MAKRARGSVRPGQRRPIDRRPATPASPAPAAAPTPKPAGLSDAELERAAQLESEMLAQEKAAEQARKRTRERSATREVAAPAAAGSFAAQEAREYAYVARDVRDIIKIASLLLAILLGLYILIDVVKVVPIGG